MRWLRSFRESGLGLFGVVALGQTISLLGSNLANFAMGVWAYEESHSVTRFALLSFFSMAPLVVLAPWAGALVDRWDRRWTMLLGDAGSALATLVLAFCFWRGWTDFWLVCLICIIRAIFTSVQLPAFAALTPQVVSSHQLARANGMVELGTAVATLVAPLLAGFLFALVKVQGMILIEFATFLPAVATLLLLRGLPRHERQPAVEGGSLLREAGEGWHYIRTRRGLLNLLILFAVINFTFGSVQALITPLILSIASSRVLGAILSAAGLGMVLGGVAVTIWAGPRRRIPVILGFIVLQSAALLLGGVFPHVWPIAVGAFVYVMCQPVLSSCSQTIWQSKVPAHLHGRVFAMRRMVAMSTLPLALLLAGPLADRFFEPAMSEGGFLAGSLGRVLGTGQGRGIGLFFIALGLAMLGAVVMGLRTPALRHLEKELPDVLTRETGSAAAADSSSLPATEHRNLALSTPRSSNDFQEV
jgi:DHA3 family macrolide efflux protein-like MFS transporter